MEWHSLKQELFLAALPNHKGNCYSIVQASRLKNLSNHMTFHTPIMLIMASLLTLSIPMQGSASPLIPYSANYSAEFNGLEIKATNRIEELSPGQYRETFVARNILGKIDEEALFHISEDHQLIPKQYSRKQSIMGVARKETQLFDWPNTVLLYTKKGQTSEIPIIVGTLDVTTHKLELRRDLQAGKAIFSYPVISRKKLKQYTYEIVGLEVLETAIGPLNTVKMQRVATDEKRQTTIWFAADWDYLIVKLMRIEDGESYYMDLIDGEINNNPVIPLKIITEK